MSKVFFASNTILPPWNSSEPPLIPCNSQFHFKPTTRRHLITSISILITPFLASDPFSPFPLPVSHARGLFQMHPFRFTNRYFLVRAGESEYESDLGLINTNSVSVDNGLSEKGKKQAVRAAFCLRKGRNRQLGLLLMVLIEGIIIGTLTWFVFLIFTLAVHDIILLSLDLTNKNAGEIRQLYQLYTVGFAIMFYIYH